MNSTIIINGGAGRVISAVPVLEKYARKNPKDDFSVIVYGWENLYWSHPLLQNRTVPAGQKDIFNGYIKNNHVVVPEPYLLHGYYNQKLSLTEAFDQELNNTSDHSDLEKPNLYISTFERNSIKSVIAQFKQEMNKTKVVVIQPYGSGIAVMHGRPFDNSHRSLDCDNYLELIKALSPDCLIIFFGPPELRHPGDEISADISKFNPDLRMFMSFIAECDYFIGCDSVGQHLARAFDKPGAVFMGSTFEVNVTYPKHFRILRKKGRKPHYSPIRLPGVDGEFADRLNDGILMFTPEEMKEFANIINRDIYD